MGDLKAHAVAFGVALVGVLAGFLLVSLWNSIIGTSQPALVATL